MNLALDSMKNSDSIESIESSVENSVNSSHKFIYSSDLLDSISYENIQKHKGKICEIFSTMKSEDNSFSNLFKNNTNSNKLEQIIKTNKNINKALDYIIFCAIALNASDIHFELDKNAPKSKQSRIRMRFDGILSDWLRLDENVFLPLCAALKLRANINIANTATTHDGRFSIILQANKNLNNLGIKSDIESKFKSYDFRVNSMPLVNSESVVARILRHDKSVMELEEMGFGEKELAQISHFCELSSGLILITGPTGSGKSTTMHGILSKLKNKNLKIITIEEPVEYKMPEICQIQVSPKLPFAEALRGILRQDPDVIAIGEVRDFESLQIALRAAFTGHLVLATLHTNDALDSVPRLLDMGAEPYYLAQALSGVIAQRLLRCFCPHCAGDNLKKSNCKFCNQSGFFGRSAIAEVVPKSAAFSDFIERKITKAQMLEILKAQNPLFSMQTQAQKRVELGITNEQEICRVLNL